MMLSELRQRLESLRAAASPVDAALLAMLLAQVAAWLRDSRTPRELLSGLQRGLGGIWLADPRLHRAVHEAIDAFGGTVASLGGMTMNERLVMFDLMDRWDASDADEREALYRKLEARAT